MNKPQTISLSVAAAVLVVNLLFPPWVYTYQRTGISQLRKPAGYALIFSPPPPLQIAGGSHGVAMDTSRLFVQSLIVLICSGVAFGVVTATTRQGIPTVKP